MRVPLPKDAVLVADQKRIAAQIAKLVEPLATHFADKTFLEVLVVSPTGLCFASDLLRLLPYETRVRPVAPSPYSGGGVFNLPLLIGCDVLLLDGLCDPSTHAIYCEVAKQKPASLTSCTMFSYNPVETAGALQPHFVGGQIRVAHHRGFGIGNSFLPDLWRIPGPEMQMNGKVLFNCDVPAPALPTGFLSRAG